MRSCKDCINAIFVEKLGEYKCKIRQHVVGKNEALGCRAWRRGVPGDSKKNEEEE